MKRTLLSLLFSTLFVVSYFLTCGMLWGFLRLSDRTLERLMIPLGLPRYIYQNLFGLQIDKSYWLIALEIISVLIMYSAMFYLVFALYARIIRKPKIEGVEYPPAPPVFKS